MNYELNDLSVFAAVAKARSFTRAAAQLGVSQSALSHTVRGLEQKLGLQLLARTTRSVSPTAVGAALLKEVAPALEQIATAVSDAWRLRDRPAGRVRLLISRIAAPMILVPKLAAFVRAYPDIDLDVSTVSGPVDLIAAEFDAGIQIGEFIQRDMIAMRVSKDQRYAVVGSPDYFETHATPRTPRDLQQHQCIGIRTPTGSYRWEFQKGRRALSVNVTGPLTIDDTNVVIQAALDGVGLGLVLEDQVLQYIANRRLIRVLEDWCPPFPGFFLFYPSRRNQPAALTALISALRLSK